MVASCASSAVTPASPLKWFGASRTSLESGVDPYALVRARKGLGLQQWPEEGPHAIGHFRGVPVPPRSETRNRIASTGVRLRGRRLRAWRGADPMTPISRARARGGFLVGRPGPEVPRAREAHCARGGVPAGLL
jgi:hypothetical protein